MMANRGKHYDWKIKSLAKGIDVNEAVIELERIESLFGSLTPENVLNASRDPSAILHPLFEWDDSIAAERHRIQQARTIINNVEITIVSSGADKVVVGAFEVIKKDNKRSYINFNVMSSEQKEFVQRTTEIELNRIKEKLSVYTEFATAIPHIDAAIESIKI